MALTPRRNGRAAHPLPSVLRHVNTHAHARAMGRPTLEHVDAYVLAAAAGAGKPQKASQLTRLLEDPDVAQWREWKDGKVLHNHVKLPLERLVKAGFATFCAASLLYTVTVRAASDQGPVCPSEAAAP